MESKTRRLLECSVCLEEFKDPRILPCYHTFCRQCLQSQINSSGIMGEYSCPVCRANHKVPAQGIAGIQKNFYVTEMFEMKSGSNSKHPFCKDHPTEDMRFYCVTCKKPICRDCKVVSHDGHKIDMITTIAKQKRVITTQLLEKLRSGKALLTNQRIMCLTTYLRKTSETKKFLTMAEQNMKTIQEKLQSLTGDIRRDFDNWTSEIKENDQSIKRNERDVQSKLQKDIDLLSAAVRETDDGMCINKCNVMLDQTEVILKNLEPSIDPPVLAVSDAFIVRFSNFNKLIKTEIEAFEKEYYGKERRIFTLLGKRKDAEEQKPGPSSGVNAPKKARVETFACFSSDETSESSSSDSSYE